MKKINIFSALFVAGLFHAQTTSPSTTENYVHTKVHLSDPADQVQKQVETIQYFDGLGRAKQIVNVKASPSGKDVVTPIEYDGFGRQVKDFLPIPQSGSQNGAVYSSPLGNASAVYGSEKIFSEKLLENSPLDRIQQQIQVGNDWTNKPVKFEYDANTAEDQVRNYETNTTWDAANKMFVTTVQTSQYFQAAQLYKNTVTDEDGNKTIEFKNGQGQTVLIRKVLSSTENADSYYVYNEYNQLAYMIPPLASKTGLVDQATLDNLCYQYRHDSKYKLVEKKLPGKGWEYMVYDKSDRLVLSQDANLKAQNKWLITKYDQFGRAAYTGFLSGGERAARQNEISNLVITESRNATGFTRNGMTIYYTDNNFAGEISTILSVNYYGTYPAYSFNPAFPSTIMGKPTLTDNPASTGKSTNDLPVMSLVKNIENDNWTKNYNYYDTKARLIGTYSINHLGGYTKTETELDFAGVPKQTKTYHKRLNTDTERIIAETFEYDHQNRLKKHYHQVNSQPQELLTDNTYNELSQLTNKKVGNNLQSIDFAYNIRGWMTRINDPANLNGKLFGYELKYTNPTYNTVSSGKYNGNIAEIDWKTSQDGVNRRYSYQYDPLNRLKNGIYSEPDVSVPQNNFFNESINYDQNGNITSLQRNSQGATGMAEQIDNLTYVYTGNRLTSVTDAAQNISGYPDGGNTINYDSNGNMVDQLDKGISSIQYNYLNLPDKINLNDFEGDKTIETTYRADGVKQKKLLTTITNGVSGTTTTKRTTDYLDGFQYTTTGLNPVTRLQFVPTSEGYFDFLKNKYIYNYTDHLGNIRLSYFNNGSGAEVLEESNYYPFGLKHTGYNALPGNPAYKYGYNGKELQTETGWNDYGARFYMPDLGRWGMPDPLSEEFADWTPYNYAFNNPIRFIDPDGNAPEDFFDNDEDCCSDKGNFQLQRSDADDAAALVEMIGGGIQSARAAASNLVVTGVNLITGDKYRNRYEVDGASLVLVTGVPKQTTKEKLVNSAWDLGTLALTAVGGPEGALMAQGGKAPALKAVQEIKDLKKAGRSGKQARLKELANDPKVSSFNRGWIKNEMRHLERGDRKTIRNPRNSRNSKTRGTELAHPRNKRAKDGNGYQNAKLQDADLHKLEHKYGGYK